MRRELLVRVVAGAAGTVTLSMLAYLDMAVHGRPASQVPAQTAAELAESAGVELRGGDADGEVAQNRQSGLGALLGGLGTGLAYGAVTTAVFERLTRR